MQAKILEKTQDLLGTSITIKLPKEKEDFFSFCFDELKRIESKYSRFLDTSQLSIVNGNLNVWQKVDEEFFYLVKKGIEFKDKTNGYFSLNVKTALEDIGYDKNYSFVEKKKPIHKKILSILKTNNLLKDNSKTAQGEILLREETNEIYLKNAIDFGGLGKGFALDSLSELLKKNKIHHFFINAGGDILASQEKDKLPWKVLLEHPDDSTKAIGEILLNNYSIASSSNNRRNWGKGKHHIIDPKTLKPSESDIKSIFVLAKHGIEADAYATALFVAGMGSAIEILKKIDVDALIISTENKFYKTSGFNATLYD